MFRGYRLASPTSGKFPEELIAWESMQIQPEQVAELSAYETSENNLVRKTAKNKRFKMSFQTVAGMTNRELDFINDWIDNSLTSEQEQKLTILAWNDRKGFYYKYDCYIPNMTYQERGHSDVIKYKPITYTFISYGAGTLVNNANMAQYESSWQN